MSSRVFVDVRSGTLQRLEIAGSPGSAGRFFAYLSRVDNQSGDAVFLLGDRVPTLP